MLLFVAPKHKIIPYFYVTATLGTLEPPQDKFVHKKILKSLFCLGKCTRSPPNWIPIMPHVLHHFKVKDNN